MRPGWCKACSCEAASAPRRLQSLGAVAHHNFGGGDDGRQHPTTHRAGQNDGRREASRCGSAGSRGPARHATTLPEGERVMAAHRRKRNDVKPTPATRGLSPALRDELLGIQAERAIMAQRGALGGHEAHRPPDGGRLLALRDRERPGPPRGKRQARRGHNSGHSRGKRGQNPWCKIALSFASGRSAAR